MQGRSVWLCEQRVISRKTGREEKNAKEDVHASFLQPPPSTGDFVPRREPNLEKKLVALLECVLPALDRNDQAGETGWEISRGLVSELFRSSARSRPIDMGLDGTPPSAPGGMAPGRANRYLNA